MSGFYGTYLNGGSQFIKHPLAVINNPKMKYVVESAKSKDTLVREPIQIIDEKLFDVKIDSNGEKVQKSKKFLVDKQNCFEKLSKEKHCENLRKKKNQAKEKGIIKLSIKKMQNKIDELSEVIKKRVSTEYEECADDSKTENVINANDHKLNKKKTVQALLLITGILLYSFILVLLSDEQDSSTNEVKFNLPRSTSRKSLINYLFNISSK